MNKEQNTELLIRRTTIIFVTTVFMAYFWQTAPFLILPGVLVYVLVGQNMLYQRQHRCQLNGGREATFASSLTFLFIAAAVLVADETQNIFTIPLTVGFAGAGIFLLVVAAVPAWIHLFQIEDNE